MELAEVELLPKILHMENTDSSGNWEPLSKTQKHWTMPYDKYIQEVGTMTNLQTRGTELDCTRVGTNITTYKATTPKTNIKYQTKISPSRRILLAIIYLFVSLISPTKLGL